MLISESITYFRESMTLVLWISPWLRMAILTIIKGLCLKS